MKSSKSAPLISPFPDRSAIPQALKQAFWIWQGLANTDLHNSYALFRKAFVLVTAPKRARLSITADQAYRLYINGTHVCSGPARGFQAHWLSSQRLP